MLRKSVFIIYQLIIILSGCVKHPANSTPSHPNQQTTEKTTTDPDDVDVIDKLRIHCRACHAVGGADRKFLVSDDNNVVWNYLLKEKAPSGKSWIKSIIEVLSWPNNQIPSADQKISATRRYMPIGQKKYAIAAINPETKVSDRQYILSVLTKTIEK